jgi:hypothetical protein
MNNDTQSRDIQKKRASAVRTAWALGFIALAIFATFIGSAVIGR